MLFLVGGYDGSGNYGDVLQLATAIDVVRRLPGSPLAVPVVEREPYGHHSELMRRYDRSFEGAAFAFFQDDDARFDAGHAFTEAISARGRAL